MARHVVHSNHGHDLCDGARRVGLLLSRFSRNHRIHIAGGVSLPMRLFSGVVSAALPGVCVICSKQISCHGRSPVL